MAYLTYFDLVESLIASSYGGPQDAEQRDIRTAVHRAYDELTTIRDWPYYHVHGRITLQAPHASGTITTSGLTVTVTNGQWPAWAAQGGYLKVGNEISRVAHRTSNLVLQLDPGLPLKADFTNVPYTLYRSTYPLPSDFRNLDEPSDEWNWWAGLYVTPDQAMKLERVSNSVGEPYHWTVVKDADSPGWAIKIVGYPTKQETLDFIYRRTARPIRWSGHEASAREGTASGVLGTATITTANFRGDINWVGAIVRIGGSQHPGSLSSVSPYVMEGKILSQTYQQNPVFTLDTVSQYAPTSVKFLVTDPIDIAPHMHQAMDSACDYWLARIRGKDAEKAFAMYQRDLRLCMEQDQLAPISGRSRHVWHDGGWRSPLLPDQG